MGLRLSSFGRTPKQRRGRASRAQCARWGQRADSELQWHQSHERPARWVRHGPRLQRRWRHGSLGSAASRVFKPGATKRSRPCRRVNEASDGRVCPSPSALGGPPPTINTASRSSTEGLGRVWRSNRHDAGAFGRVARRWRVYRTRWRPACRTHRRWRVQCRAACRVDGGLAALACSTGELRAAADQAEQGPARSNRAPARRPALIPRRACALRARHAAPVCVIWCR